MHKPNQGAELRVEEVERDPVPSRENGQTRLDNPTETQRVITHLVTLAETNDLQGLTNHLGDVIKFRPATELLDILEKEESLPGNARKTAMEKIAEKLVPHIMQSMTEYLEQIAPKGKEGEMVLAELGERKNEDTGEISYGITDGLNPREQFYLALLCARDRAMAEHSMDLLMRTYQSLLKIDRFKKVLGDPKQKAAVLKAAKLHDLGKMEAMPDFVLNNPLERDEQVAVYIEYLCEKNRSAAKLPEDLLLADEEKARYQVLLENPAELDDAERARLADEILQFCQAAKVNDVRSVLPTRYLLEASRRMLKSGKGTPITQGRLQDQRYELEHLYEILERYALSDEESFLTSLGEHEGESQMLIERANRGNVDEPLARVLHIVSRHHDHPTSRHIREQISKVTTVHKQPRDEDKDICQLVRIDDILVALTPLGVGEHNVRSYSRPKTWSQNKAILLQYAAKGYIDPDITSEVIEEFLNPKIRMDAGEARREARRERGQALEKLHGRIFQNLRKQWAEWTMADVSMLENEAFPHGIRNSGKISSKQSAAILAITNGYLAETQNSHRAEIVRLFLEENLEIVTVFLQKVLHGDEKGFSQLLQKAEEWARGATLVKKQDERAAKKEAVFVGKEKALQRFAPAFHFLHDELQDHNFVRDLGLSELVEVDEGGSPSQSADRVEANTYLMGIGVDTIMDAVELYSELGNEDYAEAFRAYLGKHPGMVLMLLSSAKNGHQAEFDTYMNRIDRDVRDQQWFGDLDLSNVHTEQRGGEEGEQRMA